MVGLWVELDWIMHAQVGSCEHRWKRKECKYETMKGIERNENRGISLRLNMLFFVTQITASSRA